MYTDQEKLTLLCVGSRTEAYEMQIIAKEIGIEKVISNVTPKEKAEQIKKLKEDGHTLILITARGGMNRDMIKVTEERLQQNEMNIFDKYYWATENKDEVCVKENVDIMIDDSVRICSDCIENGITTILMDTPYNRYSNIQRVKSWKEFYRYVSNNKKN